MSLSSRTLRAEHETCLVATRGKPKPLSRSVRSTFEAPAGRHSAKPDAFYKLVETLAPGPWVELFARRQRAGWTCYGNELEVAQPRRAGERQSIAMNRMFTGG